VSVLAKQSGQAIAILPTTFSKKHAASGFLLNPNNPNAGAETMSHVNSDARVISAVLLPRPGTNSEIICSWGETDRFKKRSARS